LSKNIGLLEKSILLASMKRAEVLWQVRWQQYALFQQTNVFAQTQA
jgi:hypothetical protein